MTRFEKVAVVWTTVLTTLTGVAYFGVKYLLEPSEPWAVINHPVQPWLLKAHILVAPLLVFSLGMIAVRHVWALYRAHVRLARRSGVAAALAIAPMVLSGYLIQAVTAERALQVIAITHIVLSALFALAAFAHFWWPATRAARRRRHDAPLRLGASGKSPTAK